MKVLIVSTPTKLKRTKHLWGELSRLTAVRHEILEQGAYSSLKDLADRCDFSSYDRTIIDNNLRRMGREYKELARIPGLVIFDFDFFSNYIPGTGVQGKLESVLKTLGPHRILVSSVTIKDDLKAKGFDAGYSPKGYDAFFVQDLALRRDIDCGFIGRSNHRAYDARRAMLQRLQSDLGLQVLRTEENEEYNRALNRIRIFINPDLGYNEVMIKNFEAMAAGCALVAPAPPPEEATRLGWVDSENVMLYRSFEELLQKTKQLQNDSSLTQKIAAAGKELAVAQHRWEARAPSVLELLEPPLCQPPPLTWRDRWNLLTV